jgi:hypothetical protein
MESPGSWEPKFLPCAGSSHLCRGRPPVQLHHGGCRGTDPDLREHNVISAQHPVAREPVRSAHYRLRRDVFYCKCTPAVDISICLHRHVVLYLLHRRTIACSFPDAFPPLNHCDNLCRRKLVAAHPCLPVEPGFARICIALEPGCPTHAGFWLVWVFSLPSRFTRGPHFPAFGKCGIVRNRRVLMQSLLFLEMGGMTLFLTLDN